jgi:hypothetical protein
LLLKEVQPNSPASRAGICPEKDYIVGTSSMVFNNPNDIFLLLELYDKRKLIFFVYNSEDYCCRECPVVPDVDWGGQGSLGCTLGAGLLHQVVKSPKISSTHPTEKLSHGLSAAVIFKVPAQAEKNEVSSATGRTENCEKEGICQEL